MRNAWLYALALLLLLMVVSVSWWTVNIQSVADSVLYTVESGDTVDSIADVFGVSSSVLAQANGMPEELFAPAPGDVINIPRPQRSAAEVWTVHGVGLASEVFGVLLSFWLALVAGLLPAELRRQVLGLALALGIASYAAAQGVGPGDPVLTPSFVFGAVKDGFAWSAAFPLFAKALGMQG